MFSKIKNLFLNKEFLKFLLVGVVNTLVGCGLMFLLYNVAHCDYWISSASNYIVGGIVSYFLNKYFTFKNQKKSLMQVLLFILNLVICYVIAYVLAKALIYKVFDQYSITVKDNIAMFAGMCLYTGLNFIGQKLLVFKEDKNE